MTDERYLSLPELTTYSGLSRRTLQRAASAPLHPLPCYHTRGRVLFLKSDFDTWLRTRTARATQPTRVQLTAVRMPLKGVR